jgi:hypothetical protein
VFWRYSAPILAAYALLVPLWLGGSTELLPWAIAALLAELLGRLLSGGRSPGDVGEVAPSSPLEGTLGLADAEEPDRGGASEAPSARGSVPEPEAPAIGLGLLSEPPPAKASTAGKDASGDRKPKPPHLPPGLLDW